MPKEPDRLINNKLFVDEVKDRWGKIFNYLTFAGFQKKALYPSFDERFWKKDWLPAHPFGGKVVSRLEGYLMYEEAFYEYLKTNPQIREWITNTASEVYDIQPSNVDSGLDYTIQECGATHLQDISIRRVLTITRLKFEEAGISYDPADLPTISIFKGNHLVQIRGKETEGFILNPGQVPFHRPELALGTYKKSWWKENSVEDIYQRNKVLLVDPRELWLFLSMLTKDSAFLSMYKNTYFRFTPDEDRLALHCV